ncbi:MAG: efflux transporter outer membrane subunit [Desulfarculus sp.]|nr:efflux transporter outer membrane subunit [Desulfarculus sp.]
MLPHSRACRPWRTLWLALVSLALPVWLLAGCLKVGPDFSRPDSALTQAWLEAQDTRILAGQPLTKQWWKVFGDPRLESLVLEAYEQNLDLRTAGLRVLEARAQLAVAVGSLYPQTQQISASNAYSVPSQRGATAAQPGMRGGATSFWQDSAGLNLAWELDFWGKYRRGVEGYQAALESQIADYDNALVSLTAQVATSYVTLRTAQRRLAIARGNVAVQREGLKIAEARHRHGATSELDVQQALNVLHSTQATIPDLEKSVRQAGHALSLYLGRPPMAWRELEENAGAIPNAPPQVATGIPADLLRRRPDIRKAERDAAAQCARVGVAKADLYPSFSLSGNLGLQASNVGAYGLADIASSQAFTAGFSPTLTWNIFNYGQIVNKMRVQDAKLQQALTDYQGKVLSALKDVEDALVSFLRAQDQSVFLGEAAKSARQAVDLSYTQYREGQTYYTTVLVAQQNLLTAEDNLASAQGAIALNLITLFKGLGGGWELREGRDFVPAAVQEEMSGRTDWGALLPERTQEKKDQPAGEPWPQAPVW